MIGNWKSINRTVEIRETWFKPIGNTMTGLVRMVKDGQLFVTQLQTIFVNSDSVMLKLKHFDAKLAAWEEKDEWILFPVESVKENEIQFRGMTYSQNEKGQLIIAMHTEMKDGTYNNQIVTLIRDTE
ncbi:MAG: hypothetical protein KDD94_05105 [Calditrichaeota bacterium]|nr:hypothetical protein [Calditrichota bacterium]